MNNIILCEGKTDAILIGYFLTHQFSYQFSKEKKKQIQLPVNKNNHAEVITWFENINNKSALIAIWAVGGYSNFENKIKEVLKRNSSEIQDEKRFDKMIVFFDKDQKTEDSHLDKIKNWFNGFDYDDSIRIGEWKKSFYSHRHTSIPKKYEFNFLTVMIPPDSDGALETFLLDSIKTNGESIDGHIVDQSRKYISEIPNEPYLKKDRYHEKACLGVVLSVFAPENYFNQTDKRLQQVAWENFVDKNSIFKELKNLIL